MNKVIACIDPFLYLMLKHESRHMQLDDTLLKMFLCVSCQKREPAHAPMSTPIVSRNGCCHNKSQCYPRFMSQCTSYLIMILNLPLVLSIIISHSTLCYDDESSIQCISDSTYCLLCSCTRSVIYMSHVNTCYQCLHLHIH